MRRHNFTALGISVLLHFSLPALVFFAGSNVVTSPAVKTLPISLSMFKPAPTPPLAVVEPVVAKVEPPPKPKPEVKLKPRAKPKIKKEAKPRPKPEPVIEPVVEQEPVEEIEAPIEFQPEQLAIATPIPTPVVSTQAVAVESQAQSASDPNKLVLIEASYQSRLRQLIESKKKYPRRAKRLGHEGLVYISFVVLPDGTIQEAKVKEGSGTKILDQAAIKTILSVSGALPFPDEVSRDRWSFTLPIAYELL